MVQPLQRLPQSRCPEMKWPERLPAGARLYPRLLISYCGTRDPHLHAHRACTQHYHFALRVATIPSKTYPHSNPVQVRRDTSQSAEHFPNTCSMSTLANLPTRFGDSPETSKESPQSRRTQNATPNIWGELVAKAFVIVIVIVIVSVTRGQSRVSTADRCPTLLT